MILRPYQTAAIDAVWVAARTGQHRQLLAMPTGVGRPVSSRVASAKQCSHLSKARAKRGTGFTPDGIRRLRAAAYRSRPWASSTGPRSELGKHRVAYNALKHGVGVGCRTIEPWASIGRLRANASMEQIGADLADLWRMFEIEPPVQGADVIDRLFGLANTLYAMKRWGLFLHLAKFAFNLHERMAASWMAQQDGGNG